MRKILFSIFIFFSNLSFGQTTASFSIPDTVCVNSPVNIQNTSQGATTYFWNFCTANINQPPIGTNLGNVGGQLSAPVYIDYVFTNGNYYGFVTNNHPGGLVRLDFGNSLLNTPIATNLGNIGGAITDNTEGVQVADDNGNWYVLIVGGDVSNGSVPSLTTVSLGTNIGNNSPTATNWGGIGNLSYPHDLYVFNDKGHWYGLTANFSNNSITLFDFTTSFANTPSATNLGNIGNLNGPTGIQAMDDNGSWRVFVTNALSSKLSRLDFGSSLLNIPSGVDLGNPNNAFASCRDIYILKYCGENEGFVVNALGNIDIVKLDFGNSLSNIPTALSLGNQGSLDFPHCISKLFRVGADVFSFIANVNSNSLSLVEFPGCTNASIPNSNAQNPLAVTYNTPGIYNINLTIDDGLPTQSSYCKQIVVLNLNITKSPDTSLCVSSPVQLLAAGGSTYTWLPTAGLSNPNIANPIATPSTTTKYYVTVTNAGGCSKMDSVTISIKNLPVITKSNDTAICITSKVQLLVSGGATYSWSPTSTLDNPNISNPVASPLVTTKYYVTVTNAAGCSKMDSITVKVNNLPVIIKSNDAAICVNSQTQLSATGGTIYSWSPAASLNNPGISNPIAKPLVNTKYYVTVTNANGCSNLDSIQITVNSLPVISKSNDTLVCQGSPVPLFASGGSTYSWTPSSTLNNSGIANPIATPITPTTYIVNVTNTAGCSKSDSIKINIKPVPVIAKSNDTTICNNISVKLFVAGGNAYLWSPASTLDDPTSATPVASPLTSTIYRIRITDILSCTYNDSVKISVKAPPVFAISPSDDVCKKSPQQLTASGGNSYTWSPASFLNNPGISNPVAMPDTTITYFVTITESTCNESATLFTTLTVLPLPDVQATSSNDITCTAPSSHLKATGALSYVWSPASNLDNADIVNPTATPGITTVYTVVGKDINGCTDTDTVSVKVAFNINTLYGLPNSFTPNGDGINDCFGVKYWGQVNDLDFNIYNRFGEKVFHTNSSAVCWDGTYKGKRQDADIFVYTIKAKTACGLIDRKGTIALLR